MEKTAKERLLLFIKTLGYGQSKFESLAGLSNGYVSKLKSSPSTEIVRRIVGKFPELNPTWLLTGEGEMLNDIPDVEEQAPDEDTMLVPLLPISAQAGRLNDFVTSVMLADCEKIISPIKGVDFAIRVTGESMAPDFPPGSQVLIKKINDRAFIDWGKTYVLDTCNGTVMKILVPSEKDGCVRCMSKNPNPIFAPFDVHLSDVYGVYRVLLCMAMK